MIDKNLGCNIVLEFVVEYIFDDAHHSFVFKQDNICIIIDDNICEN